MGACFLLRRFADNFVTRRDHGDRKGRRAQQEQKGRPVWASPGQLGLQVRRDQQALQERAKVQKVRPGQPGLPAWESLVRQGQLVWVNPDRLGRLAWVNLDPRGRLVWANPGQPGRRV